MKRLIVVAFLLSAVGFLPATAQKIGHVNTQAILEVMPEYKAALTAIDSFYKKKQDLSTKLYQEYMKKRDEFQRLVEEGLLEDDSERQLYLDELSAFEERIQKYQQSAQKEVSDKEAELSAPILEKIKNAIDAVAKENKYAYIIDNSSGILVYFEETNDVTPLVKKKLNITE